MSPIFELAGFTIRDGAEAAMLAERPAMIGALRRAFPGLLAAWLTRRDDGSWLDVVVWRSWAEAECAAARVDDVPEASAWFRHIAASQGLQHVDAVDQDMFAATPGSVPDSTRSTATLDCTLQAQPRNE